MPVKLIDRILTPNGERRPSTPGSVMDETVRRSPRLRKYSVTDARGAIMSDVIVWIAMRYKPRPRQREPFGQTNHKRCVRRPYVPVDKFERTHDHPADVRTHYLHQHDPAYGKQQSYNRPRTQDQNPSRPSHIWCGLQQWVCRPSATDYSRTFEGDL